MVSLMDRLLKLENLDLHLTPYRVLATGHDEGMLEFIPSKSLAQVGLITIITPFLCLMLLKFKSVVLLYHWNYHEYWKDICWVHYFIM